VDEDKRSFVRRRILTTLLGGYRINYNEEDEDSKVGFLMHLLQILIYLIMPANVIIFTQVFKEQRSAAIIIGGIVPLIFNLVVQTTSYVIQRRANKGNGLAFCS